VAELDRSDGDEAERGRMIPLSITRDELALLTPKELEELEGLLLAQESAELSGSFHDYVRAAWHVLEPTTPFVAGQHIAIIGDYLEAVDRGDVRRLIINIPPRMGKSLNVTVFFPTWVWARRPQTRWMFASYSGDLATKHSVDRRTLIQSAWYQDRWGGLFAMASDQNRKTEFENTARGAMIAVGVGGSATGKGGDYVIVDDPHNPIQAESDLERQSAIDFFDLTLSTRLDDPKTGRIVVVMQRLHELDLSGHLLRQGGWTTLRLPMEAEVREEIVTPAGRAFRREPGELLAPGRFGPEEVADLKARLGSYGTAGQLQQRPSPAEGGMVKRAWWRFYDAIPDGLETVIQSWDCTFKETKDSDFVVGQVWGKKGASCYLLDEVRARMDFPTTLAAIRMLSAKWPQAITKLVEDKANGPAVISMLQQQVIGLIPVEPLGSKEARIAAVSPAIEAGNCYLPASAAFTSDFVEELAVFPAGANDDRVDACSQALNRLVNIGTTGMLDWYRAQAQAKAGRAA
jgi:predicted phage terminase large subunit-like protein